MKGLFDVLANDNLDEITTQFNEYDYSSAGALIAMCIEEYCLAHNLDATEMFRDLLDANLKAVEVFGKYKQEADGDE